MDNYTSRGAAPARQPARPPGQPQRQPQTQSKKKIKTGGRWFRAIVMVLATIAFCVFLALFMLQSATDLFGLNQVDQDYDITIPSNATIQDVAQMLADKGVIDQQFTFTLYAGLKPENENIHEGNYVFNSNMGYEEILTALRTGRSQKETVWLPLIEGWTLSQIADKLEEAKVCDAEEFIECLDSEEFNFRFMDELPLDDPLRFHKLEGYIFPDTYEFYVGENVDSVARKFLRNFEDKITNSLRDRMLDLNLSLDEAITLASVIQKEASSAGGIDEMKRVSSVFHNRLDLPEQYPKLQSDVTLFYVESFIKPYLTERNQEMYDAYNTYQRDGLPVAPICNPGIDAIEAALYPAETEYYFFVTDVLERFYYSTTMQEHNQKVWEAAQVDGEGEMHGTATASD